MDRLLVSAVAGFALVVGSMALVWYMRRRSISQIDDPSILLSAPPPGMTPAAATVVEGAPVRLAFIAGMLDLAGRGEITFVDESASGGRAKTGIEIGGADLTDPRVESNRRRPAGEAETWLLGQLQLRAGNPSHAPWDSDLSGTNLPLLVETGEEMLGSVVREAAETPDEQSGTAATQARERGLLAANDQPAQHLNEQPDPRLYITAREAAVLATPFLFGTFLETYARRHGWLGAMPLVTRLRWRIVGVVAAAVGIAFLSIGVNGYSDTWTGLGMGLFLGALVMIWRAPMMVQPTRAGGLVRAQLAAYRRTLEMTFKSAASIGDAVGPSGLPWLTTPDEAIAWAVALGLSDSVRAVLARSSTAAGTPASLGQLRRKSAAAPAQMFEGIQDIGQASERAAFIPAADALVAQHVAEPTNGRQEF